MPFWFKFVKFRDEEGVALSAGRLVVKNHCVDEASDAMDREYGSWNDNRYLALNGPFGPYVSNDEANTINPYQIDGAFSPSLRIPNEILKAQEGKVICIAQTIYETERWSDVAILVDALEELGLDNQEVISHCRTDHSDAKGCWVIDLIRRQSGEDQKYWWVKFFWPVLPSNEHVTGVEAVRGTFSERDDLFRQREENLHPNFLDRDIHGPFKREEEAKRLGKP